MASLRDFVFGFRLEVIDHLSGVLKNVETRIKGVNEAVSNTAHWREAGQNLAVVGGAVAGVGLGIAYGLKKAVDAAGDMQAQMAHVATAMSDGLDTQKHLVEAKELAEKLSISSGLAAKQEAEAYYIARSNMLDHTQALAAMDVATKLTIGTTQSLADAQEALEPTTRLLTTMFENFGDKSQDVNKQIAGFADTLANLQTKYAFKDIGELNYALQYAVPLAKSAGIAVNDMAASLALLSRSGLHGAEAGTAFEEVVSKFAAGKKLKVYAALTATGGLDMKRSLQNIAAVYGSMPKYQEALALHELGFSERSIKGVALMLDQVKDYGSIIDTLNNSQGAAANAAALRMAAFDYQTGKLGQSWELLKEKIGTPLLAPLGSMVDLLSRAINATTAFATVHPKVMKFIVTFAAIGAALAVVVGGAVALAGGLMVIGSFIGISAGVAAAVAGIGIAISASVAALYTWKDTLLGWGSALGALVDQAWNWGIQLIKNFAGGMLSAALYPIKAVTEIAKSILGHFKGNSPPPFGPLHELSKVRIVETIAQTMKPAPAVTAMRRVAAAIALAAPIIAAPAFAGAAYSSPIAASFAGRESGRGGSQIVVHVTQNITINGGGNPREIMALIRGEGPELAKIIMRELEHDERRKY